MLQDHPNDDIFVQTYSDIIRPVCKSVSLNVSFVVSLVSNLLYQVRAGDREFQKMQIVPLVSESGNTPASAAPKAGTLVQDNTEGKVSARASRSRIMTGFFALNLLDRILFALSDDVQLPDFPVNPSLPPDLLDSFKVVSHVRKPGAPKKSRIAILHEDSLNWHKITKAWELPPSFQPSPDGTYDRESTARSLANDLRTRQSSAVAYSNVV